jgi:cell division protease FtsH
MKCLFFLLPFVCTNLFINAFVPLETLPNMENKVYSYQQLMKPNIKKLYTSSDLTRILTVDEQENLSVLENINPLITKGLLDNSIINNIDSFILKKEDNVLGNIINTLSFPVLFFLGYLFLNNFNPMNKLTQMLPQKNAIVTVTKNVTLSDWVGSPEVKLECAEIVSFLENNTNYINAGAQIPKGILMEGSPGCGKTLLAAAIAVEANANFYSISGSEFVELFVGLGAARVRNLFADARKNVPAIIFIDEIDAIGRQRGAGINMGNDEREQTLNQLLTEMDGFNSNDQIIVIGATNRKDVLDNALLRPGRFDRIITIPLPDKPSRKEILQLYLKEKKVEENLDIDFICEQMSGFSGAQIKNIVNEAAILAARAGEIVLTQQMFNNVLEKSLVGIKKSIETRDYQTLKRVAIHELGHALLALQFNEYFDFQKVTISSTYSGAGGFTVYTDKENITTSGMYTKDMLRKRLAIILGGKAAETIFYGEDHVSLGATQDLKQANNLARKMISSFGMGDKLKVFYEDGNDSGMPFLGRDISSGTKYSEKTRENLDEEALELVNNAYHSAIKILSTKSFIFEKMTMKLILKKELGFEDFI